MKASRSPSEKAVIWCTAVCVGLVLLYLGLTTAAWFFVRHVRHIEGVAYADIALPTRWERYKVSRGNHHVASAFKLLAQGKFNAGFQQLRIGLARAPQNRDGRMALAGLYAQTGRVDLAQTTLLDGLGYHANDQDYVTTALDFLSSQAHDRKTLEICSRLMADPLLNPAIHTLAALRSAQASIFMGNYDEAEAMLTQSHLNSDPQGRLLLAQIEWERGYQELALIMLRNLADEFPANEAVYAKLAAYLKESGLDDELGRRAVLNQLAHPDSIRSYIDRFYALARADDPAALPKAVDQAYTTFQDSASALLALADYAATEGEVSLVKRIADRFITNAWADARATQLMVIEATLVMEDYAEALVRSQQLLSEPDLEPRYKQIATGLQALAFYGVGDPVAGYANLSSLMTQSDLRAESLLGIANRLLAMERQAPAREILAHAVKLDPRNQAALTRLLEFDLDHQNIPAVAGNLRALTAMRHPSPVVLKRAQTVLGSDSYLFLPGRAELLTLLQNTLPR